MQTSRSVNTVLESGHPKETGSGTLAVRAVDQPVLRLAARVTPISASATSWFGNSLAINQSTTRRLQTPTTTAT